MNTPEQNRIIGANARTLLDNELLISAFAAVDGYLNQKALACDPDNKESAQRIILSKQLLFAIKREIERHIETGAIAAVEIEELERKKLFKVFRR